MQAGIRTPATRKPGDTTRTPKVVSQRKESAMTQAMQQPRIRNGVNVDQLFGTLDAIKAQPALGTFQFRVNNRWLGGAHNQSTVKEFYGAGQEDSSRATPFILDAGEPPVLIGTHERPNPAEFALHAQA